MAVEEAQIEAAKTSEALTYFPPHRRRHLKSETCRTLLRILSLCYDESPPSFPAQKNVDHHLNTEKGSDELGQRIERQASQHVELVGSDSTEPKDSASEKVMEDNLNVGDNGFGHTKLSEQMTIDKIDQLMRLDENEGLSNQKDVSGFQEPGFGSELMLIDKLEDIVQGNEDNVDENNLKPLTVPLVHSQSGINEVVLSNNQKEHVEVKKVDIKMSGSVSQKVLSSDNVVIGGSAVSRENNENIASLLNTEVLDPGTIRQQKDSELNSVFAVDSNNSLVPIIEFGKTDTRESHGQKISEDLVSSLDERTVANTTEASNKNNNQRSQETNLLKVEQEISPKDMELEKPVCYGNIGDSGRHMMGNVDMEEGEISGGYSMDDISMDMLLQDAVVLDGKKVNEEPITDKEEFSCSVDSERDFGSTLFLREYSGGVGLYKSDRNKTVGTPDIGVNEKALSANEVDASDAVLETQKIESKGSDGNNKLVLHGQSLQEDATRHHKISTEKNDAEVSVKKRGRPSKEKRAKKKQKERKKRAEKNRQLGVKRLKLPLISKPKTVTYCRHFLVGRCQEGDKCKFSHDTVPLTKSKPCCHFARHSCMKGDDCPFDHQLSKYPCGNFVSRGSCSRGDSCMFSHKIFPKEDAKTISNAMEPEKKLASLTSNSTSKEQPNNGSASQHPFNMLSCSAGIQPHKNSENNVNETVLKPAKLVSKGTGFLAFGSSSLVDSSRIADAKVGNHIDQHGSSTVQNSIEVNKNPTVVAPKGINFLSFGRAQQNDLSGGRLAGFPSSRGSGLKLSPSDNSNMHNQTGPAPNSNSTLDGIQPAATPKGINFLSFGKSSVDDSCDKGKMKLPFSWDNGSGGCVKEKQYPLAEQQYSSTTSSALPSYSFSLVQSPSCRDSGVKLAPSGNSNMRNQTSSAPDSNSTPNGIQPAVALKGINFLSFGKSSIDDSCNRGKVNLPFNCDNGTGSCVKEREYPLSEQQDSITTSSALPSSVSLVQSPEPSSSRIHKDTPHSAQKALLSTLAFAAKYESRMKQNQSILDPSVGTEINKEANNNGLFGDTQNDLAKALRIFELLSSISRKSKQ